jgi:hypothetical protein
LPLLSRRKPLPHAPSATTAVPVSTTVSTTVLLGDVQNIT